MSSIDNAITTAIARFSLSDAAIDEMHRQYSGLSIAGLGDGEGAALVKEARKVVRNHRVQVEKTRKALKADALAYGRAVDAEAKRLTGLLLAVDSPLCHEEKKAQAQRDLIKAEAKRIRDELVHRRIQQLLEVGFPAPYAAVEPLNDDEYGELLTAKTQAHKARIKEAAEAEEERKAEEERLAAERTRLVHQRKEQEAEQTRIDAEKKRLAEEQAKRERAKAALLRAEKLKPEAEKVMELAHQIDGMDIDPDVSCRHRVLEILSDAATKLQQLAGALVRGGVPE